MKQDKQSETLKSMEIDCRKLKGKSNSFIYKIITGTVISFLMTVLFIIIYVLGVREISIFGFVLLPEKVYRDLVNSIFTQDEFFALLEDHGDFVIIGIFVILAIAVLIGTFFYRLFKKPKIDLGEIDDSESVKFSKPEVIISRGVFHFIQESISGERNIRQLTGSVLKLQTELVKERQKYVFAPDKSKKNNNNIIVEFPVEFDSHNIRNYMSEQSWISLATNLMTWLSFAILVISLLVNISLNIIASLQFDPYFVLGPTSWMIMTFLVALVLIIIYVSQNIYGSYAVFRVLKVYRTPMGLDRYLVVPHYWEGMTGREFENILKKFAVYQQPGTSTDYETQDLVIVSKNDTQGPEHRTNSNRNSLDEYNVEYYTVQNEILENKNKEMKMDIERQKILIEQLSSNIAKYKKLLKLNTSIEYAMDRSLGPVEFNSSREYNVHNGSTNNTVTEENTSKFSSSIFGYIGVIILISFIGLYWLTTVFDSNQVLVIIIAFLITVLVISVVAGLLVLRHYLNDTSTGRKINFG